MTEREKLLDLIIAAKREDPETGSFTEWLTDYLLANGVTVQKWIPVSERLPDVGDRCLCNVKSFAFPGSFYQAILKYDKFGFVEDCIYTDDVTHWMPLPEPPKEEDK